MNIPETGKMGEFQLLRAAKDSLPGDYGFREGNNFVKCCALDATRVCNSCVEAGWYAWFTVIPPVVAS